MRTYLDDRRQPQLADLDALLSTASHDSSNKLKHQGSELEGLDQAMLPSK